MVNSLARSSNPAVTVSHTSTILQPKGGVYNFIENSTDGQNATLSGTALAGDVSNGVRSYTANSGDTAGLRFSSSGGTQNATIYYGQSFLSKISIYIKELTGPAGTLAQSTNQANVVISDFNEEQAELDEKITSIKERYMTQFSAMETAVTGFKKTGEFFDRVY